jgi:hypothetical protein
MLQLLSIQPGFGVDQLRDDCVDTYWQERLSRITKHSKANTLRAFFL